MKLKISNNFLRWVFVLCLGIGFTACSGDDEELDEDLENNANGNAAGLNDFDDFAEGDDAGLGADLGAVANAANAAAEAAPAPAAPQGDIGRRVHFAVRDGVPVRSQANASAQAVAWMARGDHSLVNVEGEWGKISDDRFVHMSDLSARAVPRSRYYSGSWGYGYHGGYAGGYQDGHFGGYASPQGGQQTYVPSHHH